MTFILCADLGAQPKLERKAVLAGDSSSGSGSALDDLDLPVAPVDRVPIDGVLLAKQNKVRPLCRPHSLVR